MFNIFVDDKFPVTNIFYFFLSNFFGSLYEIARGLDKKKKSVKMLVDGRLRS